MTEKNWLNTSIYVYSILYAWDDNGYRELYTWTIDKIKTCLKDGVKGGNIIQYDVFTDIEFSGKWKIGIQNKKNIPSYKKYFKNQDNIKTFTFN